MGKGARSVREVDLRELAKRLLALGASALADGGGVAMSPPMAASWPGAAVAGPAYTLTCGPGDNLALHVAITRAPAGSVLVADASRSPHFGYWGEVLTAAAQAQGIVGLVIDGGVRDIDPITMRGFPMFSNVRAHRGATKEGKGGSVGGGVTVADAVVQPRDWIIADSDGVTVVPSAQIQQALATAETKAAREIELFDALDRGSTTIKLLGLDPTAIQLR